MGTPTNLPARTIETHSKENYRQVLLPLQRREKLIQLFDEFSDILTFKFELFKKFCGHFEYIFMVNSTIHIYVV